MRWILPCLLALAACSPDDAGQQVGHSLYTASVNTGHALAVAGDRTGQALQDAGANLSRAFNPPAPEPVAAPDLPPPYVPEGFAAPGAVTATPLPATPPVPAMGY